VLAALVVVGAALVALLSPWGILSTVSYYAALLVWALQSYYAVYEARLAARLASGQVERAHDGKDIEPPPPHLNRFEKLAHKARELIGQQLDPNEFVKVAFPAYSMSFWGGASSYTGYYVGLLQNELVIVEADFWGKPASVRRVPISRVEAVEFRRGLLLDRLMLVIGGEKPIRLQASRFLREYSQEIAESLVSTCGA
jgi:hypothetical protein